MIVAPSSWSPRRRLVEALRLAWSTVTDSAVVALLMPALRGSSTERASALLASIQALPYVPDPPGVERLQTSAETAREGGDCEDKAALFAVLARAAGLPAEVIWFSQPSLAKDHVTARVRVDGAWLWAETTIPARLGEHPYEAAARLGLRRADLPRTAGRLDYSPAELATKYRWYIGAGVLGVVATLASRKGKDNASDDLAIHRLDR